MAAVVALVKVVIIQLTQTGPAGQMQYGGIVTLQAQSDNIDIKYEYQFSGMASVEIAIQTAATVLRKEIGDIAGATMSVQYPP